MVFSFSRFGIITNPQANTTFLYVTVIFAFIYALIINHKKYMQYSARLLLFPIILIVFIYFLKLCLKSNYLHKYPWILAVVAFVGLTFTIFYFVCISSSIFKAVNSLRIQNDHLSEETNEEANISKMAKPLKSLPISIKGIIIGIAATLVAIKQILDILNIKLPIFK